MPGLSNSKSTAGPKGWPWMLLDLKCPWARMGWESLAGASGKPLCCLECRNSFPVSSTAVLIPLTYCLAISLTPSSPLSVKESLTQCSQMAPSPAQEGQEGAPVPALTIIIFQWWHILALVQHLTPLSLDLYIGKLEQFDDFQTISPLLTVRNVFSLIIQFTCKYLFIQSLSILYVMYSTIFPFHLISFFFKYWSQPINQLDFTPLMGHDPQFERFLLDAL